MDEDILLIACGFLNDNSRARMFLMLDVNLRKN